MIPIVVQAKSGSTRVPYKNAMVLPGHLYTLTDWALVAGSEIVKLIRSRGLEAELVLSSGFDNNVFRYPTVDILDGVQIHYIQRPLPLDGYSHSNRTVLQHALFSRYRSEQLNKVFHAVILQPTSPFRHQETIDKVADLCIQISLDTFHAKGGTKVGSAYFFVGRDMIFNESVPWEFPEHKSILPYDAREMIDIDTYDDAREAAYWSGKLSQTILRKRICVEKDSDA